MHPEIIPLDPADEATVEAVQDLRVAVDAADTPDFPPPCPRELRATLVHQGPGRRYERFVARAGGQVVGYVALSLPLLDNLNTASAALMIHPDHRRRGIGRAMHEYVVERMRGLGRKWLSGSTVESLPGGPPRPASGRAFAAAMGAKAALDEVRRRLDLDDVDEEALSAMLAEARAKSSGYRLVTWRDRTPDEYVADTGYLDGRLNSDAPTGDLVVEAESVDVDRLRNGEQLHQAAGMRTYSAGAVHEPTGRLVALTTVARMATSPWHAGQWITLVDPDHRGHRLGALVKIENLRHARAHEPELRIIDTWNAAVNSHMITINEAMGFRPVDSWIMWQQEV